MGVDMRRMAIAAVDAAFDQYEKSNAKKRSGLRLRGTRALLLGAALMTAGRVAFSARGRGLLDSLEQRISDLEHPPEPEDALDDQDLEEPEDYEEEGYDAEEDFEEEEEPEDYEDEGDEDFEEDEEPEGYEEEDYDEDELEGEEDEEPEEERTPRRRSKAGSRPRRGS